MNRMTPLAAACLAAFTLPAVAQTQPYPFENVARGHSAGGLSKAKQDLILSNAQLQGSGVAHLIPVGAEIDFSKDALLAVRMGSRPTGGYAIRIRSISVRPSSGSVPGGPAVSLTTQLQVEVVARSPGPMDQVSKGFTSPYHLVKIPRPAAGGLVASFETSDEAVDFDTFSRNIGSPFVGLTRRVEVSKNGAVTVQEWGPGGSDVSPVQVSTRIDDRFMGQLRAVLGRVDFESLPIDISGPTPALDGPHLTYLLSRGSSHLQRVAGDRMSITPETRARLLPLDELIAMIRDEAVNSPQIEEFKGTVMLNGDDVVLSGPQRAYVLTGERAKTVGMFAGETVKISGAVGSSADRMEVAEILYPTHQPTLVGTLQLSSNGATLATGTSNAELRGPAAPALRTANSFSLVVLDGWVFDDLNTGKLERIYAVSAEATVTARYAFLLPHGWARRGEKVAVIGLSRSGVWARVKRGDSKAFMRLSHLRIGESAAIAPASGGSGPGLSGSVGK